MTSAPPLFGLVLAGGASTRMRQDKALLAYHGRPQLHWAYDMVAELCSATFVSVRPDQRSEPTRASLPQIVDRQPGIGPIAGISAALNEHPKAAWLVVACDLPFLTTGTLRHLIAQRDPRRMATAYRSSSDGLPEPLCAIWEPVARETVAASIAAGRQCPRKLLLGADVALLDLPEVRALDNVNTSEEYNSAAAALGTSSASAGAGGAAADARGAITLRVQYYALFREQAGRSEEVIDTTASTPADLYAELRERHPFSLGPGQLKVAINTEFSDWNARLAHGDTVVFIPPVAGG